jgi:hypothetical protein
MRSRWRLGSRGILKEAWGFSTVRMRWGDGGARDSGTRAELVGVVAGSALSRGGLFGAVASSFTPVRARGMKRGLGLRMRGVRVIAWSCEAHGFGAAYPARKLHMVARGLSRRPFFMGQVAAMARRWRPGGGARAGRTRPEGHRFPRKSGPFELR